MPKITYEDWSPRADALSIICNANGILAQLSAQGYDVTLRQLYYQFEVNRIALNFDQIQQYAPPPNPAKITDSRADKYIRRFGNESWELDALNPATLDALIESYLDGYVDTHLYNGRFDEESGHRSVMSTASQRWGEVEALLNNTYQG